MNKFKTLSCQVLVIIFLFLLSETFILNLVNYRTNLLDAHTSYFILKTLLVSVVFFDRSCRWCLKFWLSLRATRHWVDQWHSVRFAWWVFYCPALFHLHSLCRSRVILNGFECLVSDFTFDFILLKWLVHLRSVRDGHASAFLRLFPL